jgi:type I restriction enzyme R subunit
MLTQELGDSNDYKREYGDTPFGLLVRKIAKLDHDSAMAAFSAFINDESLNQKQIEFILKIINHIENNGYIEDVKILMKPPFDKPYSFIKMFDPQTRNALLQTIESIKNNALQVVA